jgi:DNA repair photolyase
MEEARLNEEQGLKTYTYPLGSGIRPTPEFAKKKLADYAVNVGLKCAHDCMYCSTGAMLRTHGAFREVGRSPFASGYSIIDPEIPEKVALDAKKKRRRGRVQLCTTVDAWAPDAKKHDLGRRCLEAILAEPGWTVRILTKNAAVVEDFDLIDEHRDRVLVGISLTGTPEKKSILSVVEPNASSISERLAALQEAHRLGLRTYGMLCPLLIGIADDPIEIDELVRLAKDFGAEEVFAEAVNPRGNGLTKTEDALRENGFVAEADAISKVRRKVHWSPYAAGLIKSIQTAMRRHLNTKKLRFLLYPSGLLDEDLVRIEKDTAGVIWLGK